MQTQTFTKFGMVPRSGVEPLTSGFSGRRSTGELHLAHKVVESEGVNLHSSLFYVPRTWRGELSLLLTKNGATRYDSKKNWSQGWVLPQRVWTSRSANKTKWLGPHPSYQ